MQPRIPGAAFTSNEEAYLRRQAFARPYALVNGKRYPRGYRYYRPGSTLTKQARLQATATSRPACRFPALGAPVCLVSRVMGPIVPGRLSHLAIVEAGIH